MKAQLALFLLNLGFKILRKKYPNAVDWETFPFDFCKLDFYAESEKRSSYVSHPKE